METDETGRCRSQAGHGTNGRHDFLLVSLKAYQMTNDGTEHWGRKIGQATARVVVPFLYTGMTATCFWVAVVPAD